MKNRRAMLLLATLAGLTASAAGPAPATAQDDGLEALLAAVAVPPLVVTVARAEPAEPAAPGDTSPGTIVDVAAAAGQFETLLTAAKAADLVGTLSGDGPFTVFAPTDEAFSKLPEGALEDLLANEEQLKKVLTYHVVPGRVTAADVKGLNSAETVAGESLSISTDYGSVKVGNATVVQADVMASNGVIHVIDTVLLPGQGE